jgi:hypothetical protein
MWEQHLRFVPDTSNVSYIFTVDDFNRMDDYPHITKCDDGKDIYVTKYGLNVMLLDLTQQEEEDYIIPVELEDEITPERNDGYLYCFNELVNIGIQEPMLQWTQFTDTYEALWCSNVHTALLVRVIKGKPHAVASLIYDNNGRASIDLLFDDFKSYTAAHDEWKKMTPDDIRAKNPHIIADEIKYVVETKHFSEYIRFNRDLEFYYG